MEPNKELLSSDVLPKELFSRILSKLNVRNTGRLAIASKDTQSIVKDNYFYIALEELITYNANIICESLSFNQLFETHTYLNFEIKDGKIFVNGEEYGSEQFKTYFQNRAPRGGEYMFFIRGTDNDTYERIQNVLRIMMLSVKLSPSPTIVNNSVGNTTRRRCV